MPLTLLQAWKTGTNGATASDPVAVSWNSARTPGSLLVLAANSDATITIPTGWTLARSQINNCGTYIWYRISDNTANDAPTINNGFATDIAYAEYSGNTTTPLDVVISAGTVTVSTAPWSTGTTAQTTSNDELAVACWGSSRSGTAVLFSSPTNGFTEVCEVGTTKISGTNIGLTIATKDLTNTQTVESTATPDSTTSSTGILVTFAAVAGPPPAAPTSLIATPAYNKIILNWTDNSDSESSFRIERATDSSGSPGAYTEISSVGANITIYTDSTAAVGTTYWYRVRARNSGGNSSYTNAVSTTPNSFITVAWTASAGTFPSGNIAQISNNSPTINGPQWIAPSIDQIVTFNATNDAGINIDPVTIEVIRIGSDNPVVTHIIPNKKSKGSTVFGTNNLKLGTAEPHKGAALKPDIMGVNVKHGGYSRPINTLMTLKTSTVTAYDKEGKPIVTTTAPSVPISDNSVKEYTIRIAGSPGRSNKYKR